MYTHMYLAVYNTHTPQQSPPPQKNDLQAIQAVLNALLDPALPVQVDFCISHLPHLLLFILFHLFYY
jgi:hypothetical protein